MEVSVVVILSRFMAEPSAQRVVRALYVLLMGCVFAFLVTVVASH